MLMFIMNNLVVERESESPENPLSYLMGGILKLKEPDSISTDITQPNDAR